MSDDQPTIRHAARRSWLDPRDQAGLAVLAFSALVLSVSYWCYLEGHRGQMIEIERAMPRQTQFLVNMNEADWPEIIQLPGLGEVLAKHVLADRDKNGPFRDVDELTRVDGIGPKTLEKIRPYLMPIPQETDWADVGHGESSPVQ